jgi:predicted amidohydrolase YtcJ
MWGVHVAVNRRPPDRDLPPFLPAQALDLAEVLTAHTAGSAYVNHLERDTGTVEPGKYADLVVLDRDPFDQPADEIGHSRVVRTYVQGELVYSPDN